MRIASSAEWLRPELAERGLTSVGEFRVWHLLRPDRHDGRQAYLVRSHSPAATIETHFHVVDQFQVFVEGEGTFQRHAVEVPGVHYTDHYSTYGPIVAGPSGLGFFVLRLAPDPGGRPMPGSRHELVRRPGRNASAALGRGPAIARQADGLAAEVRALAPAATTSVGVVEPSPGAYALVLEGDVEVGGQTLARWSCLQLDAGDPDVEVRAGAAGCALVVLSFPEVRDDRQAPTRAAAGQGAAPRGAAAAHTAAGAPGAGS